MLNSAYFASTELASTFKLLTFGMGAAYVAANRQWVYDIANFNLAGGDPPAKLKILQVGRLPSEVYLKFKKLENCKGWKSSREVCENLNIPLKDPYIYSPWDYKYVYEHFKKNKNNEIGQLLEDFEILKPLSVEEIKDFIKFY